MKSFSRRGRSTAARVHGGRGLRRNAVAATVIAVAGALSLSVSALAAPTAGTDAPTASNAYNAAWEPAPAGYVAPANDGLGVAPGKIGHVWVIVLENHAYNASFTPLEGTENSYLDTLQSQGAYLSNYYGTGHSSQDNYISMVSGQGPIADDQDDCPSYNNITGSIDTNGTKTSNSDYGQLISNAGTGAAQAGSDAPPNDNGCVYPSSVKTIFDQMQAAGESWKVYAQDLDPSEYKPDDGQNSWNGQSGASSNANANDSGTANSPTTPVTLADAEADCGAPDQAVGATPTAGSSPGATPFKLNDGSANSNSQYVSKHNPLPWFQSILSSGDCNSQHVASLVGTNDKLYSDLQSASTTPDFSFIVPNNCSNGHDAVCKSNNLSGETAGYPTYNTSMVPPAPTGADAYTGGTYAESNFLGVVIPEIEASPAFKQNGLIVVTYDEAYPAFTYSGDSQVNSSLLEPDALSDLQADEAGETLYGTSLNWEPTGPNDTIVRSPLGQILSGGPGDSAYIDRPTNGTSMTGATGYPNPDPVAGTALIGCPDEGATLDSTSESSGNDNWVQYTAPNGDPSKGPLVCEPGFQANSGSGLQTATVGTAPTASAAATTVSVKSDSNKDLYIPDSSATVELDGAQVLADSTDTAAGSTPNLQPLTVTELHAADANITDPDAGNSGDNGDVFVGSVQDEEDAAATSSSPAWDSTSGLPLVNSLDIPLTYSSASATTAYTAYYKTQSSSAAADPFYNAFDATMGGGDTGAVLISPYITPGTVSNTYYNHYSLLRSLEDIFGLQDSTVNDTGATGAGAGYLGFAAQPGLATFGHDVFGPTLVTDTDTVTTPASTVTTPGSTVTTPGATVTTPGPTKTVPGATRTVTKTKTESVVPFTTGDTLAQARTAITSDKLKVAKVSGKGSHVASESPRAGSLVATGRSVTLTLKK